MLPPRVVDGQPLHPNSAHSVRRQQQLPVKYSLSPIAAALFVGCLDPLAAPPGTHEVEPPAAYRTAWQEVEVCSGLRGNFDRVHWFVIPQPLFRCGEDDCLGNWNPPHNIYLSEIAASDSGSHYFTVRHEILHDLLGGGADHPPCFGPVDLPVHKLALALVQIEPYRIHA
jgi:hypothetical protein